VHTASYFEADTGEGDEPREAFSPYALSKTLTWQIVRYQVMLRQIALTRFVIPNPFGPLDKPGFTTYLMNTWKKGEVAEVRTPDYVRDNLPVTLMALQYQQVCKETHDRRPPQTVWRTVEPSGFAESQQAFAERFALEIRKRSSWACEVQFSEQKKFPEPRVRKNRGASDLQKLGWQENIFWKKIVSESIHD
jgi:nucleoside-diphosphate-sugar epimerase